MPSTRRQLLAGAGVALVGGVGVAGATVETTGGEPSAAETESATAALEWPMYQYDPREPATIPPGRGRPTASASPGATSRRSGSAGPHRRSDSGTPSTPSARDWSPSRPTPASAGSPIGVPTLESGARRRVGLPDAHARRDVDGRHLRPRNRGIQIPGLGRWLDGRRWDGPNHGTRPASIEHRPSVDPVTVDGTIYAPVAGTNDLVALNANDGTERWRVTHHEDTAYSVSYSRPRSAAILSTSPTGPTR